MVQQPLFVSAFGMLNRSRCRTVKKNPNIKIFTHWLKVRTVNPRKYYSRNYFNYFKSLNWVSSKSLETLFHFGKVCNFQTFQGREKSITRKLFLFCERMKLFCCEALRSTSRWVFLYSHYIFWRSVTLGSKQSSWWLSTGHNTRGGRHLK